MVGTSPIRSRLARHRTSVPASGGKLWIICGRRNLELTNRRVMALPTQHIRNAFVTPWMVND
jgi:hypothetical protein